MCTSFCPSVDFKICPLFLFIYFSFIFTPKLCVLMSLNLCIKHYVVEVTHHVENICRRNFSSLQRLQTSVAETSCVQLVEHHWVGLWGWISQLIHQTTSSLRSFIVLPSLCRVECRLCVLEIVRPYPPFPFWFFINKEKLFLLL